MNGYEKLKESVINNCNEGEGCFNPKGCNHEFYRRVPGKECWESEQHREIVKSNPEVKTACTECSLRAGLNGGVVGG